MFIRPNNGMCGTLPDDRGTYTINPDAVYEWHDGPEAERLVSRGMAEEVTSLEVAQLKAAGTKVLSHPLLAYQRAAPKKAAK